MKIARQKPKISVVIPTYNPGHLIEKCLASIPPEQTEVIIVDNKSRDGSVIQSQIIHKDIRFIFLSKNTGFAHACNQGAKIAEGDYILFLNQDSQLLKDGLYEVLYFMEKNRMCAAASGKILYPDGRIQENLRRFPNYTSLLFGRRAILTMLFPNNPFSRYFLCTDTDMEKTQQVDICTGMFLLVKRDVFNDIGMFDEGFFFYVEDFDLCKRIKDAGWEVWYIPKPASIHHLGENIRRIDRTYVKMHHFKGIYRYLVKHKKPGLILRALLTVFTALLISMHLSTKKFTGLLLP